MMGVFDDRQTASVDGLPTSSTTSLNSNDDELSCNTCSSGLDCLHKEPGHSILKSEHHQHHCVNGERSDHAVSAPVHIKMTLPNGKDSPMTGSSSGLSSSPQVGSFHDLIHLWADDIDDTADAKSEYTLVVPPNRRSRSLKTTKTPPGSPSPKKMVRFADAMGLDLEKVRHFLQDQIPNTPTAALNQEADSTLPVSSLPDAISRHTATKYLSAAFPQPCLASTFLDRIRSQKVSLESVQTRDLTVTGIVRVLNISFEKAVIVRYTFDNWRNTMDCIAAYITGSNDKFSDRFQFCVHAPPYFDVGEQLEFAICYKAGGQEIWDSNNGQNYRLTCCAGALSAPGLPWSTTNAFL